MLNKQLKLKFFVGLIISVIGIGSANADIVAKVTDQGLPCKAFLKTGEEIGFLDKLELGQSVTLDAAGELTLVYFDSGVEYQ